MAGHPHHDAAPATLAVALLTVSDTRTPENDGSGALLRSLLEAEGHRAFAYRILPDDPDAVRQAVSTWLGTDGCDGVVTSGGTGISSRDRTFEAVEGLIERRLDGFGELFRMLSYAEIGSAAMLSRALGGIARGKFVFALPGSPAAVRLGMQKLVLPEIGHIVRELRKAR